MHVNKTLDRKNNSEKEIYDKHGFHLRQENKYVSSIKKVQSSFSIIFGTKHCFPVPNLVTLKFYYSCTQYFHKDCNMVLLAL